MRQIDIFAALIASLIPVASLACEGASLLSCQIGKKTLAVCATSDQLSYVFGSKAKPELSLHAPLSDGPIIPWPGIGNAIWESARFHNQAFTYEVWLAVDKPTEETQEPPLRAGVNVLQGDEPLAALTCDAGTLTSNGVFALSDAMTDAGYCWAFEAGAWQHSCP